MKKPDKGFTLIELLIVVIIIGIVMSIAIPNYLNQTWRAKERKALFNLRQMHQAQKAFWHDHDASGNGNPDSLDDLDGDGLYNDATYADSGEENILQSHIDFSLDDGEWTYSIFSGNDSTFVVEAQHIDLPRWIRMDELGDTADNY